MLNLVEIDRDAAANAARIRAARELEAEALRDSKPISRSIG